MVAVSAMEDPAKACWLARRFDTLLGKHDKGSITLQGLVMGLVDLFGARVVLRAITTACGMEQVRSAWMCG